MNAKHQLYVRPTLELLEPRLLLDASPVGGPVDPNMMVSVFNPIGAGLQSVGDNPASAWGDLDADGDLDILVVSTGGGKLYRNNGNGTFSLVGDLPIGAYNSVSRPSIAYGDYDNDNDLDIAVSGITGTDGWLQTRVYRNDGAGASSTVGTCRATAARRPGATTTTTATRTC
jgi:hypothetical protein